MNFHIPAKKKIWSGGKQTKCARGRFRLPILAPYEWSLVLPERKNVPVKTEYISVKYITCWLWWWQKFWICTRVLEVCLSPVFSSVNWIHKVASLGFSNLASIKMSAEACRKQASRLWLQAPEWLQDMSFLAANIWIGRTKYAHISWYPGQKHKFLLPQDSLASELQPVQFSSFGRARFRAQKGAVWC